MFEIYKKAYELYQAACQSYGIETISIYEFIKHLTKEQVQEFAKPAIH